MQVHPGRTLGGHPVHLKQFGRLLSVNREPLNIEPGDIEPGDPEGPPNIADLFHALEQFKEIVKQMNDCAGQDLAQKRLLKIALALAKKDIEAMFERV
jgi:hypothetical protein